MILFFIYVYVNYWKCVYNKQNQNLYIILYTKLGYSRIGCIRWSLKPGLMWVRAPLPQQNYHYYK